jgi:hypothetical protein
VASRLCWSIYLVGFLNCTGCEGADGRQIKGSRNRTVFFDVAYWQILLQKSAMTGGGA